ncbi:unnamed protein product [Paramecium octaurelia]|uniref:Uncharacterized protein n=1 Tax=Paramecium octaurelia TaxID=43137 RepID=A0A8S1T690_PAROT|nr:unnamed protein product [Paramecium octaurelia]
MNNQSYQINNFLAPVRIMEMLKFSLKKEWIQIKIDNNKKIYSRFMRKGRQDQKQFCSDLAKLLN